MKDHLIGIRRAIFEQAVELNAAVTTAALSVILLKLTTEMEDFLSFP